MFPPLDAPLAAAAPALWKHGAAAAAAFAAGAVNSIAGGGTLISFPSLLALGLTGQQANVTSTIAIWPGSIGGFWGHRQDLTGTGAFAKRLWPPSLLGGFAGAMLLLYTPAKLFDNLVPWLILAAALLLAANEPVARWVNGLGGGRRGARWWLGAIAFQFVVGLYGGYFGAGIGILMLAALGLLGLTDIHQMNGLKNFLALSINGVAIAAFVFSAQVVWTVVPLMAVGAVLGGLTGSALAHRVGRRAARRTVVAIGFLLAAWYFLKTYGALDGLV